MCCCPLFAVTNFCSCQTHQPALVGTETPLGGPWPRGMHRPGHLRSVAFMAFVGEYGGYCVQGWGRESVSPTAEV